ncbi:Cell wall protein ecm33 [Smittium mucronatum]|uniref:Cell wall protein ecm33 n=1 Tax=Smittium mucronatum TaxID=133383 RepID=A0A1R0GN90_9FUNG|nr:Cell wall protein ecm33 [Smittium mucronatum]
MVAEKTCSDQVFIRKQEDIQKVKDCTVLMGDIHIEGIDLGKIELSSLKKVHGDITVKNLKMTNLISFPKLEEARRLYFGNNIRLYQIDLPELVFSTSIVITKNSELNILDLNKFESARIFVLESSQIKILKMERMQYARIFDIHNNSNLDSIELPLLKECRDKLIISENDRLEKIYTPKLFTIDGGLLVDNNDSLMYLYNFFYLENIGDLILNGNIEELYLKENAKINGKCQLSGPEPFICEDLKSKIFKLTNVVCECGNKAAISNSAESPSGIKPKKLGYDNTKEIKNTNADEKLKNNVAAKIPGESKNNLNSGRMNRKVKSSSTKCRMIMSKENMLAIYLVFLSQVFLLHYLSYPNIF